MIKMIGNSWIHILNDREILRCGVLSDCTHDTSDSESILAISLSASVESHLHTSFLIVRDILMSRDPNMERMVKRIFKSGNGGMPYSRPVIVGVLQFNDLEAIVTSHLARSAFKNVSKREMWKMVTSKTSDKRLIPISSMMIEIKTESCEKV